MNSSCVLPHQAAAEVVRRDRAKESLLDFANAVDVPGKPATEDPNEWMFLPVEATIAAHHILLMSKLQAVADGEIRRLMVFMPPGSAKSTYTSVVFPAWFMGRQPERRLILSSYASDIARKQGRRARQIVRSKGYRGIFETTISSETSAADDWALLNGSEFMAGGINSGITGNRAHGIIIDDPVSGREEADSETIRKKTRDAYHDDLRTRLIPGGFEIIVQTRWHEDDLAGGILPERWKGESGPILCRDGEVWEVICLPAIAEHPDDPLGREIGERLWPEWFTANHFEMFRRQPRTWSALYQQRPTAETGDFFRTDWFKLHPAEHVPAKRRLRLYLGSDYAVTEGKGDWTVHVVVGIDEVGEMWLVDLWREQASSDRWVESWCDLVLQWTPVEAAEETGQIKGAVGPFLNRRAIERGAYCFRRQFPTRGDKAVRAQSIRGRMAMRGLHISADAPWLPALKHELLAFPAGKNDDQVDALGLVGQLLDHMEAADREKPPEDRLMRGVENARFDEVVKLAPVEEEWL